MALYEMTTDGLSALAGTTFAEAGVQERADLQRRLRENIEIISPDTKVIAEEFGDFEGANRRIDLLGVDSDGNLVVIELKRTETGEHMELQAVRYAAMVSTMTFEGAVEVYAEYLKQRRPEADAETELREFLGYDDSEEGVEESFGQDVRIVLASAEFSKEVTTTVLWLNDRGLDIRCMRLKPYLDGDRILLDVQPVVPLPEAEQYQVQLQQKNQKKRASRKSKRDFTKYDVTTPLGEYRQLNKRQMVLQVVLGLVHLGIKPEQMIKATSFRQTNAFWRLEGDYRDEASFVEAALRKSQQIDRKFDERRWCTEDWQLIHQDGSTYALTNQWGGGADRWLGEIFEKHPTDQIVIDPAIG